IAIENTRLFEAEQQRTRELSESLEQQTATSDVLKIISSSPGELAPVFQAMLENATRICDAKFGFMYRCDGEVFHQMAHLGPATPAFLNYAKDRPLLPGPETVLGQMLVTRQVVQIEDRAATPGTTNRDQLSVAPVDQAASPPILACPSLK